MNKNLLKKNLLDKDKWIRFLFMLLFIVIKHFVSGLITIISLFQFIVSLILGEPNDKLLDFTKNLNIYLLQIADFLTFNSEVKPFPFIHWPSDKK